MDPKTSRYWDKANSMHAAWSSKFGSTPSMHALVLAMAHGEFETRLGDSWPGEYNVGAIQDRTLNVEERAALHDANISPGFKNVDAAKTALKAVNLRSVGLHCDSSPTNGPYFVFFRVFSSDIEGDTEFLHEVVDKRPRCGVILSDSAGTEQQYAAALYASKYFEGSHKPKAIYELAPGGIWNEVVADAPVRGARSTGADLNVANYANNLRGIVATIKSCLVSWIPNTSPTPIPPTDPVPIDPSSFDLTTVLGIQKALNMIGVVAPPLVEDGIWGAATETATKAFQVAHSLVGDGVIGPKTIEALRGAIHLEVTEQSP